MSTTQITHQRCACTGCAGCRPSAAACLRVGQRAGSLCFECVVTDPGPLMPPKPRTPLHHQEAWTPEEDTAIRDGRTAAELAPILWRTPIAIRQRRARLAEVGR